MNEEHTHALGRRQAIRHMLGLMGMTGWAALNPPEVEAWLNHVHEVAEEHKKQRRPLAGGTKPSFFRPQEFRTLTAMVERIIPRTDTPGAADAGVPWYLDIVVAAETELQPKFREGLASLDARSRKQFGRGFSEAGEPEQIRLMEAMVPKDGPGNAFFEMVKAMTIVGYYSSEIGMREELHHKGSEVLDEFPGCPHGGHPVDLPAEPERRSPAHDTKTFRWPFPGHDNITAEDL